MLIRTHLQHQTLKSETSQHPAHMQHRVGLPSHHDCYIAATTVLPLIFVLQFLTDPGRSSWRHQLLRINHRVEHNCIADELLFSVHFKPEHHVDSTEFIDHVDDLLLIVVVILNGHLYAVSGQFFQ